MDPEKLSQLKISQKEQAFPKKRRSLRILWLLVLVSALAAGSAYLHYEGLLTPAKPVRMVSVSRVFPSQAVTEFNASGYVVAQRKAAVASKGTGRLQVLGVIEGSRVKEGDVIARLENDDLQAEKRQVEAQLAAARTELVRALTDSASSGRTSRRYRNLWEDRVIPKATYEDAEDRYTKSRSAVETARANIRALEAAVNRAAILLEYTNIRAPFDGVVLTKNADVGEVVAPFGSSAFAKAAVVTMADMASLMVEADVSESFLSRVDVGQACEIRLDSLPEVHFPGKVSTIVPTADRARGTVLVKVAFDALDSRVLPEMSAKVAFLTRPLTSAESRPFLAAHRDALTTRNGSQGLFKVEDNRALWVPLPDPALNGDYVVLEKGLADGEKVVTNPPANLKPDDRIKAAE